MGERPELPPRLNLSYVLPLRHDRVEDVDDLAAYSRLLCDAVDDVLVVDGSPTEVFAAHRQAFDPRVTHVPPDPKYSFANGKVDGVLTGLELARHDKAVVADDDVRWDRPALQRMCDLLDTADLVRPQNYFDPLPWHARWDTARTLLNRAFAADYPGTLGVRPSVLLGVGGYDGDAMFENLEMMRTVEAAGGTRRDARDLFVRRIPPSNRQFWQQRTRQAYDDFAQPTRLVGSLAVLPLLAAAVAKKRTRFVVAAAVAAVAVAERGRRRDGGRRVFPASCVAFAPVWVAERAVCSWLAVGSWLLWGGCRYRGRVMTLAATPLPIIQRRVTAFRCAGGALTRQ